MTTLYSTVVCNACGKSYPATVEHECPEVAISEARVREIAREELAAVLPVGAQIWYPNTCITLKSQPAPQEQPAQASAEKPWTMDNSAILGRCELLEKERDDLRAKLAEANKALDWIADGMAAPAISDVGQIKRTREALKRTGRLGGGA
jgi:hypothetical protein